MIHQIIIDGHIVGWLDEVIDELNLYEPLWAIKMLNWEIFIGPVYHMILADVNRGLK